MAAATTMDAVTLYVRDLDAMVAFYTTAIALDVVDAAPGATSAAGDRRDGVVTLGRGTTPLVVLRHAPDMPAPQRGSAGLFHTAILFETRTDLAATMLRVAQHAAPLYTGSADHLVSEAFYLDDPEGNGIELYVDRPRDQWRWDGDCVVMDSLPLDPNAFVQEHLTTAAADAPQASAATVGHVHLQVGDVESARRFYVDTLGFAATAEMPSALFVSAGGYHHHMAMNTWRSMGAGPRAVTLGLGEVSLVVPTADDVAALTDRLAHHGVRAEVDGAGTPDAVLRFDDPWRNRLAVSVGA
ncbi:VOC family protein [Sanguibacter suaedae]|uniref:VOC family protein n=1 Tax=Sanguibacter suaedae TaxID=2795737 RepID=A0A934I3B2_9MICO|nr:VOC family protein [Sanguibacter suaedae]MBI9113461.1 VOC family protein [Sanguibacter suaedae]